MKSSDGLTYDFSTLQWCESDVHSVKTLLRILNIDFFPGLVIGGTRLSHDAGQQQLQVPISHVIRRVNNPYTYKHSVPRQLLCFSLSVQ